MKSMKIPRICRCADQHQALLYAWLRRIPCNTTESKSHILFKQQSNHWSSAILPNAEKCFSLFVFGNHASASKKQQNMIMMIGFYPPLLYFAVEKLSTYQMSHRLRNRLLSIAKPSEHRLYLINTECSISFEALQIYLLFIPKTIRNLYLFISF